MRLLAPLILALLTSLTAAAAVSGHGGPIRALAVASDGETVLTGGFDYSVILWDLPSLQPLRRMIGHDAAVDAVAFLPGDRGISAGDDRSIIVWNLADGSILARWRNHAAKVTALAVAPKGATVVSAGWDRRVLAWDVATGKPRRLGNEDAAINALAYSPDGRLLASGAYDGRIALWRTPAGRLVATLPGNGFSVNALAFASDGKLQAALADGTVRVLDPARQRPLLRYGGHSGPVVSLAVSPNAALVASGSSRGTVEIWRLDSGAWVRSIYAAPGPLWALSFLPGGRRLLTAGSDGLLREWDVATGAELEGPEPGLAMRAAPRDRGAMLFRKCAACHDFEPNDNAKAGPTFWRLFGRRAGTVAGYPYSPALRASHLVWDQATINRLFAEGPEALVPGSKMPLQRMPSARDRADLIDYLKRHAGQDKPIE